MRPQKFWYLMDKAFVFDEYNVSFQYDQVLLREMKRVWLKWAKANDDYRTGTEVYGYDNVPSTMWYISDRWYTPFRLKWLIDGIEQGHFK